jgi:ribonuclease-3
VSGASCRAVALRIGVPDRLRAAVPEGLPADASDKLETERVLASVTEAVIGACYLNAGFDAISAAVVEAFQPELEEALAHPVDFKSALQERLARRGAVVTYRVDKEHGPPHDRRFDVAAQVDGEPVGHGSGRTKKAAEQAAARQALGLPAEEAEADASNPAPSSAPAEVS